MRRMFAVILVEYQKDPNHREVYLVSKETVLEVVYGLKPCEGRVEHWEAKLTEEAMDNDWYEVVCQPVVSLTDHGE